MKEILAYLFGYGVPAGIALAGMAAILIGMAFSLTQPRLIMFGLVAILMLFPESSNYGTLEGENASIIYVKGTRTFFFSFIDMAVFGTWLLAVAYTRQWERSREPQLPMSRYFLLFGALFVGHVLYGLLDPHHFTLLDFGSRGVVNILWQGMLISLLVKVVRDERDLKTLLFIMLCCLLARELFGLVRFVFGGGDPQNAYANLQGTRIKLTFWDVNDSILATFVAAYCGWKLLADRVRGREGLLYLGMAGLATLIAVLSARRTAQGGLLLGLVMLFFMLPKGRRLPLVIALALVVPAAGLKAIARSEQSRGSVIEKLLIDVKRNDFGDARRSRFYELTTAWETIREQPVFGLGPAGAFRVSDPTGLEYHQGRYDFVHSGFGHVLLKTGFVGLFLFVAILWTYLRFVRRRWCDFPAAWKGFVVASMCGFGALVPTLLVGTPIGEERTTMVMALMMAIPFVVMRACGRGAVAPVSRSRFGQPPVVVSTPAHA